MDIFQKTKKSVPHLRISERWMPSKQQFWRIGKSTQRKVTLTTANKLPRKMVIPRNDKEFGGNETKWNLSGTKLSIYSLTIVSNSFYHDDESCLYGEPYFGCNSIFFLFFHVGIYRLRFTIAT